MAQIIRRDVKTVMRNRREKTMARYTEVRINRYNQRMAAVQRYVTGAREPCAATKQSFFERVFAPESGSMVILADGTTRPQTYNDVRNSFMVTAAIIVVLVVAIWIKAR